MDYQKLVQARATAVQLRGELLALPKKWQSNVMLDGDLIAKLDSLGQVAISLAENLKELQDSASNMPDGIEQALDEM